MATFLYLAVIFFVVLAAVLGAGASFLAAAKSPTHAWVSPYECGFIPSVLSFDSFGFSYLSLLVFFVVFDLEISLLLNLPDQGLAWSGFNYYFIFIVVLCVGFGAEALCGYIRWGY
uniref:NADH-ubiquinone oxidoreductase chain 3 n=1 Tax=Khawia cf. armeniaca JB-2011 TaxID=1095099 RepID=G8FGZ5_9CEST|nr:NADH dehydrogenase subunit 3 [Khawia cf. armeniaca JB-2011]